MNILLVEDNLINQKLAKGLMEMNGWNVTIANNGLEAVEIYKSDILIDIIFMDVQMPEMDGFEATQNIRKIEKESGKHIPIVAMTAHAMKGYKETCLENGMDDYLTKPIKPQLLKDMISKHCNSFSQGQY